MNGDIGEALIYSWMKHVLKCHVVQTNWKASLSWELRNENDVYHLVREAIKSLRVVPNKRKSKIETLVKRILKQFECDCIGLQMSDSNKIRVIAAEVAFHSDGLHYTPSKSSRFNNSEKFTAHKVMQKLFVVAIALYAYLGVRDARVIFATPKINPSFLVGIKAKIRKLNQFWNKYAVGLDYSFELIADNDFNLQILKQTINKSDDVAAESEVFMRCVKIEKLFDEDSDADCSGGKDIDVEIRDKAFERSFRKNLGEATRLLKSVRKSKGIWECEEVLYNACIALKESGKDSDGWLQMALREEYRRRNDLPNRPTILSMKKNLGKQI